MKNPYSAEQTQWLTELREHYRTVTNGVCMATIGTDAVNPGLID